MAKKLATEHPILFMGRLVLKILANEKTETRRLSGLQSFNAAPDKYGQPHVSEDPRVWRMRGVYANGEHDGSAFHVRCPYGMPGDTLYVREAWAPGDQWTVGYELKPPRCIRYRADNSARTFEFEDDGDRVPQSEVDQWSDVDRWKPSIHMPKWASRIRLKVKEIRLERLQQITTAAIRAEGVVNYEGCESNQEAESWDPTAHFAELWDSANRESGLIWNRNPWVWVVEFEKVEVKNG